MTLSPGGKRKRKSKKRKTDGVDAGTHEGYPTYVAIKGTVFDVTGNKAYEPGASYSSKSDRPHPMLLNAAS